MTIQKAPTRIVATVGPSTQSNADLRRVIKAGATGFRLPLARQSARAPELSRAISEASHDLGIPVSIYLDVPGPKKHLVVPEVRTLQRGEKVRIPVLARAATMHPNAMHILADTLAGYFTTGDVLLLGDGEIAFSVVEVAPDGLIVRSYGGLVPEGRFGVAVSGKEGHHGAPPIDHATARLASAISDAVVLGSFIESATQIVEMRKLLPPKRAVWAKVETRAGVEHALEIAAVADGILLGRGDLLIDAGELDYYHYEQLAIDRLARVDVPLMIGTQLWTSSSTMFLPHRSELSYLCGLIARGIDSILLSDETTTGANPEQIVAQVSRLITRYQRN